jgi:hypothetical protein
MNPLAETIGPTGTLFWRSDFDPAVRLSLADVYVGLRSVPEIGIIPGRPRDAGLSLVRF